MPPSARDDAACGAAAKGHLLVVDELLTRGDFNPSADDSLALRLAAQAGHDTVVERLLRDPRVDPSAADNDAICLAAEDGHLSIVQRLLVDPRVDAAARDNEPVRWACARGHLPLLQALLEDPRVDPGADYAAPVRQRFFRGYRDAPLTGGGRRLHPVHPMLDPETPRNRCVRLAADMGEVDVCDVLLREWRVWRQGDEEGIAGAIRLLSAAGRWPTAGALAAAFRGLARRKLPGAHLRESHLPRPDAAVSHLQVLAWQRRRAAVLARLRVATGGSSLGSRLSAADAAASAAGDAFGGAARRSAP